MTEERGCMKEARADKVSDRACTRGLPQLGTLGSGNHLDVYKRQDEEFQPFTETSSGYS